MFCDLATRYNIVNENIVNFNSLPRNGPVISIFFYIQSVCYIGRLTSRVSPESASFFFLFARPATLKFRPDNWRILQGQLKYSQGTALKHAFRSALS